MLLIPVMAMLYFYLCISRVSHDYPSDIILICLFGTPLLIMVLIIISEIVFVSLWTRDTFPSIL